MGAAIAILLGAFLGLVISVAIIVTPIILLIKTTKDK